MNVARLLYPVQVLGPGKRIGIWLCGCNRRCKGCSNPELWVQKAEYEVSISQVLRLIQKITHNHDVDGFTITGGEPMDQAAELAELLEELRMISDDILIYSGYKLSELRNRNDLNTERVLSLAAILIDGEYIEEKNTDTKLRGSSNQLIHILNPSLKEKYDYYLKITHNQIQNFTTSDGVVSVGIHKRGFNA